MSFWGSVLKPGETKSLASADGEILHLSQACLCEPKDGGKSYLQIQEEGKAFAVACLQKDVQEHCAFDIFLTISTDLKLINKGKNEIHVVGYFEPQEDDEDDDDDDEPPAAKKSPLAKPASPFAKAASPVVSVTKSPVVQAKSPLQQALAKKLMPQDDDDDDDDDDDEEDDDDDEEMDDEDDDDDDDDDEEDDEEDDDDDDDDEEEEEAPVGKRKSAASAPTPEAKKAKMSPGASPAKSPKSGSEEDKFAARVKEFIKGNGKTPLSMLGSKVQKPAAISMKLGQFLKSRSQDFDVDASGNISLK